MSRLLIAEVCVLPVLHASVFGTHVPIEVPPCCSFLIRCMVLLRVRLGSMAEVHLGTRSPFCLISLAGSFGASGRLGVCCFHLLFRLLH